MAELHVEGGHMNTKLRSFVAGAVGMVVAFGIVELVHGLYQPVPSVLLAVAQRVIEFTPGEFATRAVETLGKADIPVLITVTTLLTLALAGFLAYLSLRSRLLALAGVVVLAVVALAASFTEPSVVPVPTILTIVGALYAGSVVARFLLSASELRASESVSQQEPTAEAEGEPSTVGVRSKEAHSTRGIAVPRRNFLLLSGGAAVAGLAAGGAGRLLGGGSAQQTSTAAPLELPGSAASVAETLPTPPPEASIDVPGMPPVITPAEDFYLIDTVITPPRIDAESWTLKVMGEVDNPIELSYNDLISLPTRESDVTLSCISNEVGGSLVSNGRWTGVLLSDVLAEAGVSRDKISQASEQLVGRSVDGWTAGFQTDIALDGREALVAFGLNGSELPLDHGYPVRLVVPGLYGYVSATKWLTEIELTDWDFDAYWIQRSWAKEGPIQTQSRIDTVGDDDNLSAGTVQIGGVAWAPHRGIDRVEVSTDNGETWNDAQLATQLALDTWRLYVYDWEAEPGEYTLKVRATDGEGETQTEEEAAPHPSGATGYHTVKATVS
ncbi:MAG: molybdopterin-dependent oxidoreductase [Actinobacteria bacterium]|nr:molybdopterin-dependent oxidoreductase [Actinomycetota bacterium]